jgi:uncharacterized membrane protein
VRKNLTLEQTLPWILLIGGLIGVFCAAILTSEKIELLKNPHAQLICNINPIVACGSVINTWQASAFGFPNTYIGLAGFGGVAVIGAGIIAGARYKRWYWLGLQTGVTFAACFITWLQFQTIFRIHALCPFCMVVWLVTIPIFIYTTIYNLRNKSIRFKKKYKPISEFIQRHHAEILISWYVIIFLVILGHFWYYWKTLF